MGVTAAVVGATVSTASAVDSRNARKDAEKSAKKTRKEIKAKEAENKRIEDESTPFSGTDAGKRIALERQFLKRSKGTGRSGAVKKRTGTLG